MILDSRLEFSSKQSLAATAASTNVIDLSVGRDIGPGRTMWVVVNVDESLVGTGTYSLALQTSDTEGSGYADIATLALSGAAGARFVLGLPYSNKQFLRLNYTVGGTSPGGKVSAWLTDQEPASWKSYPGV